MVCCYASTLTADAPIDSNDIKPLNIEPMHRVVKQITSTFAAPLFATNPNQTIYSSYSLSGAATCPTGSVQTTPIIPSSYSVTVKYYATHAHYECGTVFGPAACVTTNGYDPSAPVFNGQSLAPPASVCAIKSSSPSCSASDFSCGSYKTCSFTSGTWRIFYVYTPDPNGSFTGSYLCIRHGWDKAPIE